MSNGGMSNSRLSNSKDIKIYIGLQILILVPIAIISFFFLLQLERVENTSREQRLENIRDEQSALIVTNYEFLMAMVDAFVNNSLVSYLEEHAPSADDDDDDDTVNNFDGDIESDEIDNQMAQGTLIPGSPEDNGPDTYFLQALTDKFGLSSVVVFGQDFQPLFHQGLPVDEQVLVRTLNEHIFSRSFHLDSYSVDDRNVYQYVLYKLAYNGNRDAYCVFIFGDEILNRSLLAVPGYTIDIYNDAFRIITSTVPERSRQLLINQVTKNMLDGITGISYEKGNRVSYGFIDLKTASLFLTVEEPFSRPSSTVKGALLLVVFISIFSMLAALVVGWRLIKNNRNEIETTRKEALYENHEWLFGKLGINITSLTEQLKIMEPFYDEIKTISNNISELQQQLQEKDSE